MAISLSNFPYENIHQVDTISPRRSTYFSEYYLRSSALIVNKPLFYITVPQPQSTMLIKYASVRSREKGRKSRCETPSNLSHNKSSCCCDYVSAPARNVKTPGKQPEWPKGLLGNRSRGSVCYRFICFSRGQGRVARTRSILAAAAVAFPLSISVTSTYVHQPNRYSTRRLVSLSIRPRALLSKDVDSNERTSLRNFFSATAFVAGLIPNAWFRAHENPGLISTLDVALPP